MPSEEKANSAGPAEAAVTNRAFALAVHNGDSAACLQQAERSGEGVKLRYPEASKRRHSGKITGNSSPRVEKCAIRVYDESQTRSCNSLLGDGRGCNQAQNDEK